MATLTTANSSFALMIENLYPVPQNIQGYSTDDAFTMNDIVPVETMMGVDGHLSGGYTPVPRVIDIILQADSPSNQIFDDWIGAQDAAKEAFVANGIIQLQGTGEKFAMTRGFLTSASPMAGAKKVLQPRKFTITFESVVKSPI